MAGVRVATVSTVALVTVGVIVGNGGLGQLIFRGFNSNFYRAEIITASVLTVALGLALDLLLALATRLLTPWSRSRVVNAPPRRHRLAQRPAELAGPARAFRT